MKQVLTAVFGEHEGKVFYPFLIILSIIIGVLLVDQAAFTACFSSLTKWLIFDFGWAFQLGTFVAILFCFWLMFSSYGEVKLGTPEDKPEFTTLAWVSMMFASSFGLVMWLWYSAEIIYHLFESSRIADMGLTGQAAGVPVALQSVFMDWGFHGFALFGIGGLAVALPAYRQGKPMNLAGGLYGILGERSYTSIWGFLTDIAGALGAFGGTAAAMGLGLTVISCGIKDLTGIDIGLGPQVGIMLFLVLAFILSSVSGVDKGIRILSLVNIYITAALCVFLFIAGPTNYIFVTITEALGRYINYFADFSLWGDAGSIVDGAFKPRGWQNWWLVFYVVWWTSYIPFCGGFVARVSRGRTVREFLLGAVIAPMAIAFLCFGAWGSTSAFMQITGAVDMYQQIQTNFGGTIFRLLHELPLASLSIPLVMISSTIYGITTYDSTTYFISMQLSGGQLNPKMSMRVLVGLLIGAAGVTFLTIGDFNGLKSLGIVAGAPFFVVLMAYMYSIGRMVVMAKQGKF